MLHITDILYFYDNIKKEDSGSSWQRKCYLTHDGIVLCGNKMIFILKSHTEILQLSGEDRSCNEGRHVSDADLRNVIQLLEVGWFCCYVKRHVPSVCMSVCRVQSKYNKTAVWFYSVISDADHAAGTKQFLSSWHWLLSKHFIGYIDWTVRVLNPGGTTRDILFSTVIKTTAWG